jgi:Uma2 family endonuclease
MDDVLVPPSDLPEEDGVPLESNWHRLAMNLLLEVVWYFFRDRTDFFAGGNMFMYYNAARVRSQDFRGPDFFFVWDVERDRPRRYWAAWDEDSRLPDVIIELLSPTTSGVDRTAKKRLYERTFRTAEYYLYDPETQQFEGWRLGKRRYRAIDQDERGWLWSEELEMWLGTWPGPYLEQTAIYPRFFDVAGNLVLTGREAQSQRAEAEEQRAEAEKQRADAETERAEAEKQRAEAEKQRAEAEKQRAEGAEAENARLKARLAELEARGGAANGPAV